MPIKTSYKFDVKDKFTPFGFDDEVTHIASSWQVSDHQDFGILLGFCSDSWTIF